MSVDNRGRRSSRSSDGMPLRRRLRTPHRTANSPTVRTMLHQSLPHWRGATITVRRVSLNGPPVLGDPQAGHRRPSRRVPPHERQARASADVWIPSAGAGGISRPECGAVARLRPHRSDPHRSPGGLCTPGSRDTSEGLPGSTPSAGFVARRPSADHLAGQPLERSRAVPTFDGCARPGGGLQRSGGTSNTDSTPGAAGRVP